MYRWLVYAMASWDCAYDRVDLSQFHPMHYKFKLGTFKAPWLQFGLSVLEANCYTCSLLHTARHGGHTLHQWVKESRWRIDGEMFRGLEARSHHRGNVQSQPIGRYILYQVLYPIKIAVKFLTIKWNHSQDNSMDRCTRRDWSLWLRPFYNKHVWLIIF